MKTLLRSLAAFSLPMLCLAVSPARAQSYQVKPVHTFGGGASDVGPSAALIQGRQGYFYGTTVGDFYNTSTNGANAGVNGTIFSLSPSGAVLKNIHVFTGSNGSHPTAPLVQTADTLLWGTTSGGFSGNGVTVFHVKTDGTVHHRYPGPAETGTNNATLCLGKDGYLYGTERQNGTVNYGRIFRINPADGVLKVLYNFRGHPDGAFPNGPLVQGKDGNFYGCCGGGGVNDEGTIFRISSTGVYHQLHAMAQDGVQGSGPIGLVRRATVTSTASRGRAATRISFLPARSSASARQGNSPSSSTWARAQRRMIRSRR